jgi:two-component system, cell cycle response regulator DivK
MRRRVSWYTVETVKGFADRRQEARPQKVLVVDDNPGLRHLWSVWLSLWNFLVVEAKDGVDAIDTALRERPSLVLMDLAMPRLDGFAATRELKQHAQTAGIPVVALTAHTTTEDRRRASEAGCAGFLGKPCDPELLLTEVRRLLRPHRRG